MWQPLPPSEGKPAPRNSPCWYWDFSCSLHGLQQWQSIRSEVESSDNDLKKRKSVRAFIDKIVEIEKIEKILESAILCPSGVNMQPFEVCVVSGDKKLQIENKMIKAFDNNQKEKMDYQYYPLEWVEPFKSRRKEKNYRRRC